ncbi:MAG TPA: hypothetical protein VE669_02930 [Actinomycetota bacterium]|jgi:hypothetical protein|nr:hypothetical protein [Actinomycetota bacterium]
MREPSRTDARLERALGALGTEVAYPRTPSLVPAVTARLATERASGVRPRFPRLALMDRRRLVALAAVGVLVLLSIAAAARFVLGAAEIRVQPTTAPVPAPPPLTPGGLGRPVPIAEVEATVRFEIRLPPGPGPDEAYVFQGPGGTDGALLAWASSERYPALPGTPWGLVLLQVEADERILVKTTGKVEDVRIVRVDGERAFWLDEPHMLDVLTAEGDRSFSVGGNVLIWAVQGVTYRLETPLGLGDALALAGSMR